MSARTCADCGHRLDIHTPDGCVALHLDGSLCACPTPTPARPEGETPPCQCGHALNQHLLAGGHCEQRGCACRLFVIPLPPARERGEATPAPASGEEWGLEFDRLLSVLWSATSQRAVAVLEENYRRGRGGPARYHPLPEEEADQRARQQVRDFVVAEVARLTRELAEARDTARKDNKRYEELLDRLDTERDRRITANQEADAARAEAARLREALEFYAHGLDGGRRARRALGQEGA